MAFQRACGLLCRLAASRPGSLSQQVCATVECSHGTWMQATLAGMARRGVPSPASAGIGPGSSHSARSRYMRTEVYPRLETMDLVMWRQQVAASADPALQVYASLVPRPAISSMHCWRVAPHFAVSWARLRSGSSWLSADRISRHASGHNICSLCSADVGDSWHALAACPALAHARSVWWGRVGDAFDGMLPLQLARQSLLQFFFDVASQSPASLSAHAAFAAAIESAFAGGAAQA